MAATTLAALSDLAFATITNSDKTPKTIAPSPTNTKTTSKPEDEKPSETKAKIK